MKRRFQLLPVCLLAALSFTVCWSANALTFASVTGSGDLIVSITGTAYFDTSALELTDLTLSADSDLTIGLAFPVGVPGMATDTIARRDIIGTTELSILDDAYFGEFDFSGSLTVEAERIHVVGPLVTSGPIMISAKSTTIGSGVTIVDGSARDRCDGGDAGASLVLTGGSHELLDTGCIPDAVEVPDFSFIPFPVDMVISRPVPEPSGALLFTMGFTSFALWNRRR